MTAVKKGNMTVVKKGNMTITMPPMDSNAEAAMERCADFLADMFIKYGPEVLAEIRAEKAAAAKKKRKKKA